MRVFLLKDIENVGMTGEIVKVAEGFGMNYLIPRKLGVEITEKNEHQYKNRIKTVERRKEVIASKTSMLAEKIKSMKIQLKRKVHDRDKLFGSISQGEVVDLLAQKGVSVSKSQIDFGKSIKTTGTYDVTVKLSSKLQPAFSLTILPE
jgi:large subunit ribosomal protein L9